MNWQRASVQTAAAYMRELIASGADDVKTKAVYEGLLDVLDPTRRAARIQRESAESAKAAVVVQKARDAAGWRRTPAWTGTPKIEIVEAEPSALSP
jgi:hypothetical protein